MGTKFISLVGVACLVVFVAVVSGCTAQQSLTETEARDIVLQIEAYARLVQEKKREEVKEREISGKEVPQWEYPGRTLADMLRDLEGPHELVGELPKSKGEQRFTDLDEPLRWWERFERED